MNAERSVLALLEDAFELCVEDIQGALTQVAGGLALTAALAWAQFSVLRTPDAEGRVWVEALGLSLAHSLWMWQQSRHARQLRRQLGSPAPNKDGSGYFWRQLRWQPWSLLAVPLGALTLVGLAPASAFFHNVALLDEDYGPDNGLARKAWALSWRAQGQLQGAQALLCVGGLVVAVNVAAGAFMAAGLAKSLFGLDSVLTSYSRGVFNSTFFLLALGAAWAVLSPLAQAVHVLRWTEASARSTGGDLAARLENLDSRPELRL